MVSSFIVHMTTIKPNYDLLRSAILVFAGNGDGIFFIPAVLMCFGTGGSCTQKLHLC